ncbi:GvpL/GvpF family gas vesicle protein, partial [Streptomyces sp. NPDC059853]|uniref:GvpL/GvpF family gas vesicle protein n=1 Tax=Streptomyces sp. NPDC059853 TaxID=3346973 RepID=UPI00364B1C73
MTETAGITRPAAVAEPAADGSAVCVFAVCHRQTAPALDGLTGHPGGGPVRPLDTGPLTLITQDVPAADFAPESFAERFSDPAALEGCARAHHAVIAAVARSGPVVPLPLATLYLGTERATAAVAERAERLLALLDRLRHRAEWGLKVYPVRGTGPAAAPPGPDSASAADTGRAYLDRLRNRQQERERQHETAWRTAEHVYTTLARRAAGGPGPVSYTHQRLPSR